MNDLPAKRAVPSWFWRAVGAAFLIVVLLEAAAFLNIQSRFRPAARVGSDSNLPDGHMQSDLADDSALLSDVPLISAPSVYPEFAPEMSTLPALVPVPDTLQAVPQQSLQSSAPAVSAGSSAPAVIPAAPPGNTGRPAPAQPTGKENKPTNTSEPHGKQDQGTGGAEKTQGKK